MDFLALPPEMPVRLDGPHGHRHAIGRRGAHMCGAGPVEGGNELFAR